MSMLSAQRDKLRKVAGELQSTIDGLNKGHITYDGLMDTLNYGILCLNGAADIIWQLRNDCVNLRMENEKLRDYAYALEECRREAHYCEFCPHFHRDFEDEDPHCDFDFDALRAAAGMEVDE